MLSCRRGVPENISLECGCSLEKVGGAIEPWWLACVLEGVFTGKPLAVFRNQPLGISESLKHQSIREQDVTNVTGRRVSFALHSSGPLSWLFGSLLDSESSSPSEDPLKKAQQCLSSGLLSAVTDTFPGNLLVTRTGNGFPSPSGSLPSTVPMVHLAVHLPCSEMPMTSVFPLQSQSVWKDPQSLSPLKLSRSQAATSQSLCTQGSRPPLTPSPQGGSSAAHIATNFWFVSCF